MEIIRDKATMHRFAAARRGEGRRIGLVPTMGALHEGHLSLVRRARSDCDVVVVSIFVNPTQFAPGEDLDRYPRAFDADGAACEERGVDVVFAPAAGEMYSPAAETSVVQEGLAMVLEGASRPSHFRGVLTVVLKLFNIVAPDVAYFGRKDYQQTVVIRRMVADLDLPVEVAVLPTVREADGLAMSSRNRSLTAEEREQAACLYAALERCAERLRDGQTDPARLRAEMAARIAEEPLARVDYVEIVKDGGLEPVEAVERGHVALVAARVGQTRLIDNRILE